MKYLVLILCLFSTSAFSQMRLRMTEQELREEFPDINFKTNYTKDGYKALSFSERERSFIYFFQKNTIVMCTVMYLNPKTYKKLIQIYNKDYIKISPNQWKFISTGTYTPNIIITLSMENGVDGPYAAFSHVFEK